MKVKIDIKMSEEPEPEETLKGTEERGVVE